MHFTPPSRKEWGWGWLSADRSWRHTADGCGRRRMRAMERPFTSPCRSWDRDGSSAVALTVVNALSGSSCDLQYGYSASILSQSPHGAARMSMTSKDSIGLHPALALDAADIGIWEWNPAKGVVSCDVRM